MSAFNVKLVAPPSAGAVATAAGAVPLLMTREGDELTAPLPALPDDVPPVAVFAVWGTHTAPIPRTADRTSIIWETDFGPLTVSPLRLMVP